MARNGVDYNQVSKAALSLTDAGQAPTVDNIRTQLGGTGSKSTIAPLLKRWKAENVHSVDRAHSGLPEDLVESVQRLYESVQQRFQDELAVAEVKAATRIAELEGRDSQMRDQLAECENRARLLKDELAEQKSRLETVRGELAAERQVKRECDLACTSLEQRLMERSSEVTHLREQIEQAHQQFEHFVAAAQTRWEEEQKKSDARISAEMQVNQRLRDELQLALHEAVTKAVQLEHVSLRHERLLLESREFRRTIAELGQQNARIDEQANTLQQQLEQRTAALVDIQQTHDFALLRAIDAEKHLAVCQSNHAMLETALLAAEQRADTLLGEKLSQVRQCAELESSLRQCRQELTQLRKT
jgi:chromosome segregation ATPase